MNSRIFDTLKQLASRLLLVWLAALVPVFVGVAQLEQLWTHTDPPWGWLFVAPLPLIGLVMALSKSPPIAWRSFSCLIASIAFVAVMMLYVHCWPAIASLLLGSTVLALAATVPGALLARPPRFFGRATLIWTGLVLGLGVVAGYAEEFVIAHKAETHADGRPYCLQYASQKDPFGYEPATTLFDLNGLKMRARLTTGGSTLFRLQNHAFLVTDTGERKEWLSWSYINQAFVSGHGRIAESCTPAPHYVRKLPIW